MARQQAHPLNRSDYFKTIKAESLLAEVEVNVSQGDGGKLLLQVGQEFNYTVVYLTDEQARRLVKHILDYLTCTRE